METLQINIQNQLAVITLNRGRSNPINIEMIAELITAIKALEADDAVSGLIITGKEGFFSAGIDLIEAYGYNEAQSRVLWSSFLELQTKLTAFKKPFVAAVTGHSPAGGCVIAMSCDYRVMASGKYIIGLNEIPVGIIVPDAVFQVYAFWLGKRKAYQYLIEGKLLNVEEALSDGLIDEIQPAEEVLLAAEKKIRSYMKMNPATWIASKANLRKELLTHVQANQTEQLDKMLAQWWAPETRSALQLMIEKLKSPATVKA